MAPAGDSVAQAGVVLTWEMALRAPVPPSATTSSSLPGTNCIPPKDWAVATCTPGPCPTTNATTDTPLWPEPTARATVPVSLAALPAVEAKPETFRAWINGDCGSPEITEAIL